MNIKESLSHAEQRFSTISDSPRLDAEILLCHTLKKERSFLYTWPEHPIDDDISDSFEKLTTQRINGTPIAYLTGEREFWSMPFIVNPDVLIPRHDTEILVEKALDLIANITKPRILELGTGSGCIACAIAKERPDAQIVATDISPKALTICKLNIEKFSLKNINHYCSNWFSAIPSDPKFDIIVSNPPYIPNTDKHLLLGDLPAEPGHALHSGNDGLDAIREIIQRTPEFLTTKGYLLFEHGYDQELAIKSLLDKPTFRHIFTITDLNKQPRVSGAQYHACMD